IDPGISKAHGPHDEPFQDLVYMWLSLPRTNASSRVVPCATAPGSPVRMPPSRVHGPHEVPFQCLVYRALSVPRTNTSVLVPDPSATSGAPLRPPPSDVQLRKTMLKERITVFEATKTCPPASAGVE